MYYGQVEAGVGVLSYQDLTRQDVEEETTGMYWWRVLVRQYPRPSATPVKFIGTATGRYAILGSLPTYQQTV